MLFEHRFFSFHIFSFNAYTILKPSFFFFCYLQVTSIPLLHHFNKRNSERIRRIRTRRRSSCNWSNRSATSSLRVEGMKSGVGLLIICEYPRCSISSGQRARKAPDPSGRQIQPPGTGWITLRS